MQVQPIEICILRIVKSVKSEYWADWNKLIDLKIRVKESGNWARYLWLQPESKYCLNAIHEYALVSGNIECS